MRQQQKAVLWVNLRKKDVKDKVVDKTNKPTGTARKTKSSTYASTNNKSRKYEEGSRDTSSEKIKDSTKEYEAKEPMSPAKSKRAWTYCGLKKSKSSKD